MALVRVQIASHGENASLSLVYDSLTLNVTALVVQNRSPRDFSWRVRHRTNAALDVSGRTPENQLVEETVVVPLGRFQLVRQLDEDGVEELASPDLVSIATRWPGVEPITRSRPGRV